jgi:hypothetical protein
MATFDKAAIQAAIDGSALKRVLNTALNRIFARPTPASHLDALVVELDGVRGEGGISRVAVLPSWDRRRATLSVAVASALGSVDVTVALPRPLTAGEGSACVEGGGGGGRGGEGGATVARGRPNCDW